MGSPLDFLFGGNSDASFRSAYDNIEKNKALYNAIEDPTYAEYNPELYNYDSANYELVSEDPAVKSAQLSYLSKLAGLSDDGLSDADRASFANARSEANQIAKSNRGAVMADAQARGVGGSGLEFAMKEMGNQGAAQRANQANLAQADAASRQRAQYNIAYGNALGAARDQDYRASAQNTGIINQFNQNNTQNRNAVNQANVDARNNAFKYNEGLKDKRYQNQLNQADRLAGFNNQTNETTLAQNADRRNREQAATGAFVNLATSALGK